MPWYVYVCISALLVVAAAYIGLLAWQAHTRVAKESKAATASASVLYICDKHGPTLAYTILEEPLEWETVEGARRRGPVKVCVLCFEAKIKEAYTKLPPLPTIK